ncbi:hypothetical protein [Swaminathania salitolerans]|uniref:Uncharacterized protein n=1 Tax=Swaminathania salitolerans TaxID=182838 RepID=A0A511BXG3_9PROT|nr:hypothetical protein [Swaminathania salitolerans]GBQ12034.1 hypothetical protein AA21291_1049 [Swaminathania salitolerans LMG 21291]GEL02708.1 hypothetical protein SSA02_18710 [Swaminathania salitolerans]
MSHADFLPLKGGTLRSRDRRERRTSPSRIPTAGDDQPDLFDPPPPAACPEGAAGSVPDPDFARPRLSPERLSPDEVPLFVATGRQFTENDREDGWLYIVTRPEETAELLQDGLPFCAERGLVLMERPALFPRLAFMAAHAAEAQEDEAGDAAGWDLLRLRRPLVAPWLETEPDMSARWGAACYLLCGPAPQG